MSTGPNVAQELLTGKSPELAVGAAPQTEAKPGETPPEKTVPLAALVSEQDNTRKAREEAARYRATLDAYGFQVQDDGAVLPPAPREAPTKTYPPRLQALAERLGVEPEELQAAIGETVGPMAETYSAPFGAGVAELYKQVLAERDPDYEIYKDGIDKHLKTLPSNYRAHPDALAFAVKLAKIDHFDALTKRAVEREKAGQGKVVGRFVEGAAPGTQEGPVPEPFSEQTQDWAKRSGYTPEELAKAAARREVRGGR